MLGNLNNEILIKSYFMNNLFNLGDLVDRTADPSKLALVDLSRSGEPNILIKTLMKWQWL